MSPPGRAACACAWACAVRRLAVGDGTLGRRRAVHDRGALLGNDLQILEVTVQVGVDLVDVPQRGLVELLEDRELDALVAGNAVQSIGERLDDRRGRQRIRGGLEVGAPEQVAHRAIELAQLALALVLDHADDIAGEHRLVHRRGVDQRQLLGVDMGEVGLGLDLALHALVDVLAQVSLEIGDELGAVVVEDAAGVEAERLLLADVRPLGARHQQVADAVEHRRKGQQQAMNREVPAIAENSRHFLGHRAAGCDRPFSRGRRCAHALGPLGGTKLPLGQRIPRAAPLGCAAWVRSRKCGK